MRKLLSVLLVVVLSAALLNVMAFAAEITAKQAKEIALAKTGGGTVVECKLDIEKGRKVYEIEIVHGNTKYDMNVGVTDSKIYNYESETHHGNNPKGEPEITAKRAQEIALAQTGGGEVISCKLDFEDGVKVYEIDIVNGNTKYEVDVCAVGSQIYKFKQSRVSMLGPQVSASSEVTEKQAQAIALKKTGGGTVTKCKLDVEHGRKVYEIEVTNGNKKYEMDVGVSDAKIYNYEEETIKSTTKSSSGAITADAAKKIALKEVGGGTVMKCKLDREDGRQVYEIEIRYNGGEYEIEVDAATGKITKYEIDD